MLSCMRSLSAKERLALGQTFQDNRKKLSLSQQSLAEAIHCHQATVSRIESGLVDRPDPIILLSFAKIADIDPFELLAPYLEDDDEDRPSGRRRLQLKDAAA